MIYLDPPYGIKFGSNWQVSTRHAPRRFRDALRQTRQTSASSRRSSRRSCRTWPRADIQNGRRDERLMCGILPGITVWDPSKKPSAGTLPAHVGAIRSNRGETTPIRCAAPLPGSSTRPPDRPAWRHRSQCDTGFWRWPLATMTATTGPTRHQAGRSPHPCSPPTSQTSQPVDATDGPFVCCV